MEFVGRKVKVALHDGSVYDGFVHSCNSNIGKLSLEKVTYHEDGERKKLVGLQHFFADEIADIIAGEEVLRSRSKEQIEDRVRGKGLMRDKYSPAHLKTIVNLDPTKLVLHNKNRSDDEASPETGSADSDSEGDNTSHEYTVLSTTSTLFYEAIEYIKKHHVIGLAMEGVSIGREGHLGWIQIAVPDRVFLFDMLKLGKDGFDAGIAEVLEHGDILKVLHNCRMVSDMLYHQYEVSLVNVFDTQVANAFVYRLWHHNDWPRYVDGLAACLVQHLDLSMEEVNWAVVRANHREADEQVWLERPARRHLLEALVKNVKHLINLRCVLMEKMMEEYVAGVNIYLSHVRDASQGDANKYQREPHLLPMAFQDIQQFMTGRNYTLPKEVIKDMNGFRENCTTIKQPNVAFSKDSLWHEGYPTKNGKVRLGRVADTISDIKSEPKVTPADPRNTKGVPETSLASLVVRQSDRELQPDRMTSINTRVEDPPGHLTGDTVPGVCNGSVHNDVVDTEKTDIESPKSDSGGGGSDGELSGTSLMRVLIQEQSPEGGEDHSDIDTYNILPAGRTQDKHQKNTRKPRVVIPDLSKYPPSTGTYRKTQTEQEKNMISQYNKRRNSHSDSNVRMNDLFHSNCHASGEVDVGHADPRSQNTPVSSQTSGQNASYIIRNSDSDTSSYNHVQPISECATSSSTQMPRSRLQHLLDLLHKR